MRARLGRVLVALGWRVMDFGVAIGGDQLYAESMTEPVEPLAEFRCGDPDCLCNVPAVFNIEEEPRV